MITKQLIETLRDTFGKLNAACMVFVVLVVLSFTTTIATQVKAQIPLQNQFKNVDTTLRNKIAQKLFIDLRYYCVQKVTGYCQEPLQSLPDELASMLNKSKVGGVILFAENLSSSHQIVNLTHQLQSSQIPKKLAGKPESSAVKEESASLEPKYIPLYIGIDQESGRVSRLPQQEFLGFAGNMAIGATYQSHKTHYATTTSAAIARHLLKLGINVNFAPVLDVNNNPENPIINVRSYAQFPKIVADLGGASIQAMQNQGITVAAKHFPGHGDTFVDSHLGLPRVDHKRRVINRVDLFPFRSVIGKDQTRPDMIMTAHIQYPALDNTPFIGDVLGKDTTSEGQGKTDPEETVLPATLSHKILTGILRNQYAYNGLIVTDALNMKSITKYLSPTQAVIKSFSAGADISLMPYKIASPEDAVNFLDWLNQLTILISLDDELITLVDASYNRIVAHKAKRKIATRAKMPLSEKLKGITDITYKAVDEKLANSLSRASFTQIKALKTAIKPAQNILALMPDKRRCEAFEYYWTNQKEKSGSVKCFSLLSEGVPLEQKRLNNVDTIVVGDVTPQIAFYESVEFEGIKASQRIDYAKQQIEIGILLKQAKELSITTILTKLRSPYITEQEFAVYDGIFASYDYQVTEREKVDGIDMSKYLFSPAFSSLVKVITGKQPAFGHLPVKLSPHISKQIQGDQTNSKTLENELPN